LRRLISDQSSAHERRLIRSELETQLAHAMLANEVHDGDRVTTRCDSYGTASRRR
jgi:ATP-dependent Clp protease ATP-binding subunit ClpA